MQTSQRRKHYLLPLLTFAYCALLLYTALFPFSGWEWPSTPWYNGVEGKPRYLSKADVVTNFFIYVPLGLLLALALQQRLARSRLFWTVAGAGLGFSFVIETLQLFLPHRISSLTDVFMNGLGTIAGAALAFAISHHTALGRRLRGVRAFWFHSGRLADLGLIILILWAVSQLSPLVPALDWATLRKGLDPLLAALNGASTFDGREAAVYALQIGGLGFLANTMVQQGRTLKWVFPVFATAVILLKISIVGRQLSPEALVGLIVGVGVFLYGRRLPRDKAAITAGIAILCAYVLGELRPGPFIGLENAPFNWIPFRIEIDNAAHRIDILATVWPFMALAYLTMVLRPKQVIPSAVGGGLLVFAIAFGLQLYQQGLPEAFPDITDVLLAEAAWALPWLHPALRKPRGKRLAKPA